jgi:hypothetical protein
VKSEGGRARTATIRVGDSVAREGGTLPVLILGRVSATGIKFSGVGRALKVPGNGDRFDATVSVQ